MEIKMKNTNYISEATKFIQELLDNPKIRNDQAATRATWWDKDFADSDEQANIAKDLKPDAYPYFSYKTREKNK